MILVVSSVVSSVGKSSSLSWLSISSSDSPMSEKSSAALNSPWSSVFVASCGLFSGGIDLSLLFFADDLSELGLLGAAAGGKGFFCCNACGGSSLSLDL